MTEYVALVGVVGLCVSAAIVAWGPQLLAAFERSRGIILCPLP